MKRKAVLKKLTEIAKQLPEDGYVIKHKFYPNSTLDENDDVLESYMEQHNVNHARRLKRCYDLGGFPLVEKYLNHYNFKLEYRDEASNNSVS